MMAGMRKSRLLRFQPDPFGLRNKNRLDAEHKAREDHQQILDWADERDRKLAEEQLKAVKTYELYVN